MKQSLFLVLIPLLILCGRKKHSSAQIFFLDEISEFEFPAYLESKMGFIPIDMKFTDDSTFFLNTYYSGLFKFQIRNNKLEAIDSFQILKAQLPEFEEKLKKLLIARDGNYRLSLFTNTRKIGLPFDFATSSAELAVNNYEIKRFITLFFSEIIEASNSSKEITSDTMNSKRGIKISMRSFLTILDSSLSIQKIYPIDSDSFYGLPGSEQISPDINHVFFVSDTEFYSDLLYAHIDIDKYCPAAFKWKINKQSLQPEKFLNAVTLSDEFIERIKDENPRGFSSDVKFCKADKKIYAFQENQVFEETEKDSFTHFMTLDKKKFGRISRVQAFDEQYLLLSFRKDAKDSSKVSVFEPFLFDLKKNDLLPVPLNGSFKDGFMNKTPNYVYALSYNDGLLKLHRYRIASGTK